MTPSHPTQMDQQSGHSSAPEGFSAVQRPFDQSPTYLNDSKPVWVVHYPATEGRPEFWQGYRAVGKVPAGRMPWTVGNRRIGTDRGFASFDAAIAASEVA